MTFEDFLTSNNSRLMNVLTKKGVIKIGVKGCYQQQNYISSNQQFDKSWTWHLLTNWPSKCSWHAAPRLVKLVTSRALDSSEEGQDAPPERHQQTLQKKMWRMGRCPHISLTATVAAVALPAPPYHQHPSAAAGGQVTVTPIRTTSVRTAGMLIKSNVENRSGR